MSSRRKRYSLRRLLVVYELAMYGLVALGIGMLLYDLKGHPTARQIDAMDIADVMIACVFMTEFFVRLFRSKDKLAYMRQDWWLLLASIPITGAAGDALRALRLLGVVRLFRTVSHATYEVRNLRSWR